MHTELATRVVELARATGRQIATAESLTAGMISATLASVPGSSAVLQGGVVSYSSKVKASLLDVPAELLSTHGSVDPEVARLMAVGARQACGADVAVSATGVAGPAAHDGKAVGTVYIGWATATQAGSVLHHFVGSRQRIREQSTTAALQQLVAMLGQENSQAGSK
ncbi:MULTISPECIES: CinA family protein [Glutamicibacter]|uniref:CinA-like protein n=3 Tax=Micrococcaceae TaxID=1268 RepID=A0A5B7WRK1_9MICC|nr:MULTISPECIES: CinA family protein [Glutamicibacter]QCY46638.1 CinA-like protein [Glutamicibacter creatinolyticus]TLK57031.1 CinA family protein [Glutamicibacter sp. V16R2B1]